MKEEKTPIANKMIQMEKNLAQEAPKQNVGSQGIQALPQVHGPWFCVYSIV